MKEDDFIFPQSIVRGLGKLPTEPAKLSALEHSKQPAKPAPSPPAPAAATPTGVGEAPHEAPAPAPEPPPPPTPAPPEGVGQLPVAHVGGDANVLTVQPAAGASPVPQHVVPQASGDPNYYASAPQFDSRGFWWSAGTNPPNVPGWSGGKWTKQGQSKWHDRLTNRWVWYPNSIMVIRPGGGRFYVITPSMNLRPAQNAPDLNLINYALTNGPWSHLFTNPDYYAIDITGAK
jgi:hypothetical protein